MSIRFKFRSSVNFDTVLIDGNRDSISLRELRARILGGTSSKQHRGFDLVFSDAVTGLDYAGDDCHIPTGSSVIVKRVPGGTLPSAEPTIQPVKARSIHHAINFDPASGQMDKFEGLGDDLCPVPDSNMTFGKRTDEEIEWKISSDFLAQNASLPPELKCTLCSTFFKKAVMVPCCQHSFCEKCIQRELAEKGRCPKCLSGKVKVGNLLPNVVLDKAIKHFLESQMFDDCVENDMEKYAPDGESAVQGKETLYNIGVVQRNIESPQSSSETGKGSNQVLISATQLRRGLSILCEDSANGERDFQGENQPVIPPNYVHNEADTNTRGYDQYWDCSGGGDGNFLVGGQRKGVRTCYICGRPDHLMRDCTFSNFRNGAFHGGFTGYAPPYWGTSSYGPYPTMYNSPMVPYAFPFPSMPGGDMQVGVMGPPLHPEHFRLQQCKNRFDSVKNHERREFVGEEDDDFNTRFGHSEERSGRKRQHDDEYMDYAREKRSSHHSERHKYHYESDSSLGHHLDSKDVKRRFYPDVRGSHKKEACHDSRHSRPGEKHPRDKNHDYRPHRVVPRWRGR